MTDFLSDAAFPLQGARSDPGARRPDGGPPARRLGRARSSRSRRRRAPGEGLGGPRHGPDFQNLHRNKRSLTLDLKSPEGLEHLPQAGRAMPMSLVENYRPDVKTRLGIDYEALKPLNKRLVYASISGFGQDRPVPRPAGFRPDRAGHGRADVDHRAARAGAGARRHSDRRSVGRHLLRDGHPGRAARTRGVRRGPVGRQLAAGGADRDARLPGGALADRRGGPGAGRQRPSDQHPDRRVPHPRRLYQHRLGRRRDLTAASAVPLDRAGTRRPPGLQDRPRRAR